MSKVWYIFDRNLTYAERLTDYFLSREPLQIRLETYSDADALKMRLEQEREESLLIVSEGSFQEWMRKAGAQLVLLEENGGLELPEAIRILRFQSAEGIWEELLKGLGHKGERVRMKRQVNESAGLISFFSPAHRVLQTSFALQYGKALSETGPALFLHFDGLGNLEALFGKASSKSLMDILYLWECGGSEALQEFPGDIWKSGDYSILLNAGASGDIHSVREETWFRFLEDLQNCGSYSRIVLDLNEHVEGLMGILQMSAVCYELHRPPDYEDRMDELKRSEFERELNRQGFSGIPRRRLSLPLISEQTVFPGDLGSGELYRIAREEANGTE